jgi:hypothetical protein
MNDIMGLCVSKESPAIVFMEATEKNTALKNG